MTEITTKQLQDLISQSQFGDRDFVYSFETQKHIALKLAYDLVVTGEDPKDAIEIAKAFVDEFYHRVVKRGAWERTS